MEFRNVLLKIAGCETQCTTEHHQTKPQKIEPRQCIVTTQLSRQPTARKQANAHPSVALQSRIRFPIKKILDSAQDC